MNKLHKDHAVLISGGLGGIGKATARFFAKQGADIALCDIHEPDQADKWLSLLENFGVRATYHKTDVASAAQVREWIDSVEQELGVASYIIANAATATMKNVREISPEQWDREIQINLNGAFYMTQYATERLLHHKKSGRVVLVGSWAAHAVHSHLPAYSASKAAVRMLCKCLALELAPYDILVNEVAPGYVDAGLSGKIWKENPKLKKHSVDKVPIKRVMDPESVARQIVQLCHPQNNQMTGSTVLMDGGLSLLTP